MLVLTRKIGECVSVPCCDMTIEVLRISRSQVQLGVTAPRDTEVHRSDTFPIVRRTTKLLGLSQLEAEIRAICYHKQAMCSTGELDVVTAVAVQPCQR